MPKARVKYSLSLAEAIRRGQLPAVVECISDGLPGRLEMNDQEHAVFGSDDDGMVSAFEYAITRKRWPIAIALLHAPLDYLEKSNEAPIERRASAFLHLMNALSRHRATQPLPSSQCSQILQAWSFLDDGLQGQEGPGGENARDIFRISSPALQPGWLPLVPHMLAMGVSANASAVNSRGWVSTLLRARSIRGSTRDVKILLSAGADPLFKMHEGSLAAHATADLCNFRPDDEPGSQPNVPSIDSIIARGQCLDLLCATPGIARARNWQGQTPDKSWKSSMEWFASCPIPEDPQVRASYQARKMAYLADPSTAPSRPTPRI